MIRPLDITFTSAIGLSLAAAAVLASLWRTRIPGVRNWLAANLLASLAFAVFAWAPRQPLNLVPEIGHFLLGSSAIALVAGFRAFAGKGSLVKPMSLLLLMVLAGLTWMHHGVDLPRARLILVCCFYALAAALAMLSVNPSDCSGQARYPYLLARGTALALVIALAVRVTSQWLYGQQNGYANALNFSGWGALYLSLCAMLMPLMSLAGVAMVHDRMLREMEKEANRDFLTGAWTRRALVRFAEREIARAERTGQGLALLVMDVDRFKAINDEHGHGVGDEVLKDLVQRAQTLLRKIDILARSGGEEFSILLPDASLQGAISTAERLRSQLSHPGAQLPYTVSIGVAIYDAGKGWKALCDEADLALYEAKRQGRDRIALAPTASLPSLAEDEAAS